MICVPEASPCLELLFGMQVGYIETQFTLLVWMWNFPVSFVLRHYNVLCDQKQSGLRLLYQKRFSPRSSPFSAIRLQNKVV